MACKDINAKVNLDITDLDRLSIGARLYDAFLLKDDSVNSNSVIDYDSSTKTYRIDEIKLLELIKLVNRLSEDDKHIALVNSKYKTSATVIATDNEIFYIPYASVKWKDNMEIN
jgi:hypothetical protein